jgi:hypothetical protein
MSIVNGSMAVLSAGLSTMTAMCPPCVGTVVR